MPTRHESANIRGPVPLGTAAKAVVRHRSHLPWLDAPMAVDRDGMQSHGLDQSTHVTCVRGSALVVLRCLDL